MESFPFIEKLDRSILFAFELVSSISILLLAFGLIASMANVLTKGDVLTNNETMQQIWAWTQCIAIDASVAGSIIRTVSYFYRSDKLKGSLYALLSALLLFTAAIVSNIESVQQTLNVTLDTAYLHVHIPVELLIWIRSVAIVLLIVCHSMQHVHLKQINRSEDERPKQPQTIKTPHIVKTAQLLENFRTLLLVQTTISEEKQDQQENDGEIEQIQDTLQKLLAIHQTQEVSPSLPSATRRAPQTKTKRKASINYDRVKTYLRDHQNATVRDVAKAVGVSISTASKYTRRVKQEEEKETAS